MHYEVPAFFQFLLKANEESMEWSLSSYGGSHW